MSKETNCPDNEFIKNNLIALAKEHKERCQGDCTIQLCALKVTCDKLGIQLTEEEQLTFM